MTQVLDVYSVSSAGLFTVVVDIKEEYWADRLPQVWAELRRKGADVAATLQQQNVVVDAGNMDVQGKRMRVTPTGAFRTPEEIGELVLAVPTAATSGTGAHVGDEILRIRDLATVRRGYQEPPQ